MEVLFEDNGKKEKQTRLNIRFNKTLRSGIEIGYPSISDSIFLFILHCYRKISKYKKKINLYKKREKKKKNDI